MRPSKRWRASLALLVLGLCALAGSVLSAPAGARTASVRLGRAYRPGVGGFGQVRPREIFLGGDPTGLLARIHWSSWGAPQARGTGEAEYVWPGTAVAANPISPGARVVAFHLGTCRGRRSYNAVEWYFPSDGQSFDPHAYFNTCTGQPVGAPKVYSCKDVALADGAGQARYVTTVGLPCSLATPLVAGVPVAPYLPKGGRFSYAGYRCGSEGAGGENSTQVFACAAGSREFSFTLEP